MHLADNVQDSTTSLLLMELCRVGTCRPCCGSTEQLAIGLGS